ncbi:MAG: histidine phosphatase family protein [Clostridiales bacterium]|jgi:alpha-ribazole phosphatase|nr:histidine phosphatase family protein [Clostridiales bacterium]
MIEVKLIRHALTEGGKRRVYLGGGTDEHLCREGFAQAASLAESCERNVYASPMTRCVQTAEIMFPGSEIVLIEGFREMNFGDFEGRSAEEMKNDPEYRAWIAADCEPVCPNGEDLAGFNKRTRGAFWAVIAQARERGGERVIIVAHGGTIMSVMSELKPERAYFEWRCKHCEGVSISIR